MGYTPLFDTLTKGSLCGKWPDIGLWPVVLSMADWRGEVRVTLQYIVSVSGLGIDEVRSCMNRFCDPDPDSGSTNDEGRRLIPLEDAVGRGWRVVNIQKYRDKASGSDQVTDGRNAEKVRRYKERHRKTPADTEVHPATPTHTADSDSDSDKIKRESANAPHKPKKLAKVEHEIPEDFSLSSDLEQKAKALGVSNPAQEFVRFKEYYQAKGSKWKNWGLVWQRWCRLQKSQPAQKADPYANAI